MGWNPSDFLVQLEIVIEIMSRSMSDLPLSDIDFKDKMAPLWTTGKNSNFFIFSLRPLHKNIFDKIKKYYFVSLFYSQVDQIIFTLSN